MSPETFHASPERADESTLEKQFRSLMNNSFIQELINTLPYIVTILNSNRQIVFSNNSLIERLNVSDFSKLLGKRPGEALKCIHSRTTDSGCGTSEACRVCAAVNTINKSIEEKRKVVNECRITTDDSGREEFHDFEVTATPLEWEGESYTVFAITDISGLKRKRMLERIFFHDIMNTASNLKGLSEMILNVEEERKEYLLGIIARVSNELVTEIEDQRQLASAESGDLTLTYSELNSMQVLQTLIEQFKSNNRKLVMIKISPESQEFVFSGDVKLLNRILKNMLKNALEASAEGDCISAKSVKNVETIRFSVHNPKYIKRETQLQIFKRSFSTKGTDRGLGTYSMKLLGERYLKGKVWFTSTEKEGTEFFFEFKGR
jgi:signal transduction histidine kinase